MLGLTVLFCLGSSNSSFIEDKEALDHQIMESMHYDVYDSYLLPEDYGLIDRLANSIIINEIVAVTTLIILIIFFSVYCVYQNRRQTRNYHLTENEHVRNREETYI